MPSISTTKRVHLMKDWVKVAALGACFRGVLLLVLLLFEACFGEYDTSNHLNLHGDCLSEVVSEASPTSTPLLHRLVVWDSVHFLRIARCGYEYEHTYAFFPGFPILLRYVGRGLNSVLPALDLQAAMSISGLLVSNAAYIASLVLFHQLSLKVLGSRSHSALATVLYVMPPSSVFLSSSYTEGLFSFFSMSAMWALFCCESVWGAAFCIAASCATRSNGVLHLGFLGHFALRRVVKCWSDSKPKVVFVALELLATMGLAASPLVYFQISGYQQFCGVEAGMLQRPWCRNRVGYMYGFIQDKYWNVGFLRYFQVKQIPNFMLAAPTLGLSVMGCWKYIASDWGRTASLGLLSPRKGNAMGFNSDLIAPFVYQWAFMALYAFFVMHVQVATRFLSACPPFYWFAAHLVKGKQWKILWFWFLSFAGLGSLLFPNFYPWT